MTTEYPPVNEPVEPVHEQPVEHREHHPVEAAVGFTRSIALWIAAIIGLLALIVIVAFVVQTDERLNLNLFGWTLTNVHAGVAMLCAAIAGGVLVASLATIRGLRLRMHLHRANKVIRKIA